MQPTTPQYPGQIAQARPQEYHNAYTQQIPGGQRYVEEHQTVRPGQTSSYSYSQQTTTNQTSQGQQYRPTTVVGATSVPVTTTVPTVISNTPVMVGRTSPVVTTGPVVTKSPVVAGYTSTLPVSTYTAPVATTTGYQTTGYQTGAYQTGYQTEKRVTGHALQSLGSTVHERIVHEGYGPEIVEHRGYHRSESVTLTEEELKRLQWYEGHYELNPGEKVVHEKIVHEKVVEVPKYYVEEKIVEIPEYEYIDKIVEVPEKVQEEKIVHVPKIEYQERIVTVPKKVIKENIVEVPEIEYREIPIEKIVEVPEIREEIVTREVAVPQYVDVPVPEYKCIPVPQEIERQIPVGVEVISTYEYKMPKLRPRYTEIAVPIYVPRFIEVPVPAQMMDPASINEADKLAAQIASMSQKQTINLADFQKLVNTQNNVFGTIPANAQSQRLQNPNTPPQYGQQPPYNAALAR